MRVLVALLSYKDLLSALDFGHLFFSGGSDGKESACNAGDPGSIPRSGRSLWRREWQPNPVFLLRNPMDRGAWWVGGCPRGCTESDMTE